MFYIKSKKINYTAKFANHHKTGFFLLIIIVTRGVLKMPDNRKRNI
jgi:cytochrome b561